MDGCEYRSHCLGLNIEVTDYCESDNHEGCNYYKLLEQKFSGSITDK